MNINKDYLNNSDYSSIDFSIMSKLNNIYKIKYYNDNTNKHLSLKGGSVGLENIVENLLNQAIKNIASINKIKNLIDKKKCINNYKYCHGGINIGYCIKIDTKCSNNILNEKKYLSDFSKTLLELEENKLTYDNFDYKKNYLNSFNLKYKLPSEKENQDYNYLVQVNISKLKEYMGEDDTDSMAHSKIYTNKNIEFLAWLLAGLHAQDLNSKIVNGESIQIIESFLKYYFTNSDSYFKVPVIRTTDNHYLFNIQDGRHRLAFYSYFNVDGFVLTDKKGFEILQEKDILIEYKELERQELSYFEDQIFENMNEINQRILFRKNLTKLNTDWKLKCKHCQGEHATYQHSNIVKNLKKIK